MDDQDLQRLVRQWREGDPDAFRRIVDAATRALTAMAYRYTRDWEWARDLTQETWISVWRSVDRYDGERSFRAWVYAIHRNHCLSHLRRPWVRRESTDSNPTIHGSGSSQPGPNPEEVVEQREFHDRVLEAVARLGESQRRVFVQVDLEGGDQREVARMLDMKYTTLRTTLHFARQRVAEWIRQEEGK